MQVIKEAFAYADMIKIGHTLFALPFALAGLCLAWANGWTVDAFQIAMILVAFTAAGAAAMGFNRIVDRRIDAKNPRTKMRPTVSGAISTNAAKFFTIFCSGIFIASAFAINPLCGWLSFPALAMLLGYSYSKRFTSASHLWLGLAISVAPTAAWIAASATLDPRILTLSSALLFQIAAFDVIYALQDIDFDKNYGLHSIPARFGKDNALRIAAFMLVLAFLSLIASGYLFGLGIPYFACTALIGAGYAFAIYSTKRFSAKKISDIFFYLNAGSSMLILAGSATALI